MSSMVSGQTKQSNKAKIDEATFERIKTPVSISLSRFCVKNQDFDTKQFRVGNDQFKTKINLGSRIGLDLDFWWYFGCFDNTFGRNCKLKQLKYFVWKILMKRSISSWHWFWSYPTKLNKKEKVFVVWRDLLWQNVVENCDDNVQWNKLSHPDCHFHKLDR